MRIGRERQQRVQMLLQQRPDLTMRQPLGGGVDGQDESRVSGLPLFREHDEFLWDELASVVIADRSRHEEELALLDLALQEGAARPGALEQAAVVLEDRPEYAQAAARGQYPGAHHATDARHLQPH